MPTLTPNINVLSTRLKAHTHTDDQPKPIGPSDICKQALRKCTNRAYGGLKASVVLFQNLLEYLVFTMNASKGIILSKDPNSGIFELKASLGIDDSISKKIFRENLKWKK